MPSRFATGCLLFFLLAAGMLDGCGQMRPMGSRTDLIRYTVKPGDTLYSISWRYGYDHHEVAAWNNIPPPYNIYPGQDLLIISPYQSEASGVNDAPEGTADAAVSSAAKAATGEVTTSGAATIATAPAGGRKPGRQTVENSRPRLNSRDIDWQWPTSGNLRSKYAPNDGKKGLDIEGRMGQAILAAASGKVVYSGNGLIGYGNLIIIKHDDHYLSAYGHNSRLLVNENTEVKQGEKIAEMGDGGKDGVILHFEIRHDGKPVDPLRYLPKQGS